MEIRALRYFLETAREENMSLAAKRLYVSQSAYQDRSRVWKKNLDKSSSFGIASISN